MVVLLKGNHVEVLPWWHSGKESELPVSRNFTGIRSGQEIPETAAHKMLWSEGLNSTSTAFPYPKWGLLTQEVSSLWAYTLSFAKNFEGQSQAGL